MTAKVNEAKIDRLFGKVEEVRVSTARIEEHLKTLNGSVVRHQKCLDEQEITNEKIYEKHAETVAQIEKIKRGMAYSAGAFAVIIFLLSVIGDKISTMIFGG